MLTTFDVNNESQKNQCKRLDYEKKDGTALPVIRGNL